MKYLKPLRPFFAWSQLSIPTVYDDSLSYYEVLNKCIFHFNEMLKTMQENYEIIDEAFAKILEECEAAIARCEEAAARAEAAQSAAEKAQAAAEAAQAAAEAAQKLAEAAQAAAEAARDDAVTAQKAAEAAQAAAEAAQAAAEAAQQKAETAQAAAEAAQAKAEDAQEKAESARDAAQAAQTAAEAAQQKAEEAQTAAESARDAAEAAQRGAEAAQEAAEASEQAAADSAADAAASAEEIKNALDNYYDKTESDAAFVKKAGDTMTGNLVMGGDSYIDGRAVSIYNGVLINTNENTRDLNNYKTNGFFRSSSNYTYKNTPVENINIFLLIVNITQNFTDFYFGYQILINLQTKNNNTIYFRRINADETWENWKYFTTQNDIEGNYLPLSGGTMTGNLVMSNSYVEGASSAAYFNSIPDDITDLNNLNTNGYYTSRGNLTNAPNFEYYLLYNNIIKDSTHITQVAFQRITGNNIAVRNFNSKTNSWNDWTYFATQKDITDNYLPLSGGTMMGNILGSKNSFTSSSNNAYFDGFSSGLIIHPIPEGNPDINSVTEPGIYYTSNSLNNFSNIPKDITSLSWFMITKYPNGGTSVLLHELTSGKIYVTKSGVYESEKITPNSWVRLDNITEEPTDGTPIFYKRVYSTDNKFFANIYKIAGDEKKAKVDIYANNLNSEFNLSFSTDFQTFPAIFKIDETQSNFNTEDLPFDLKTSMDLVIGNYMVEKSSRYIGLVNLNYIIGFSGGGSYIKPYFNGILLESSVLNRGTISGTYPVFITSFINNVKSRWSWD